MDSGRGGRFLPVNNGYRAFLMNEARYSRLTREFQTLFVKNEKTAMERYQHLLKLKEMYAQNERSPGEIRGSVTILAHTRNEICAD